MARTPEGRWTCGAERRSRPPAMERQTSPSMKTAPSQTREPEGMAGLLGLQRADVDGHTPPCWLPTVVGVAGEPTTVEARGGPASSWGWSARIEIAAVLNTTTRRTRPLTRRGYRPPEGWGQRPHRGLSSSTCSLGCLLAAECRRSQVDDSNRR
jgi:hypothetical protein